MSTSQGLSTVRPSDSGHGPPASVRHEPQRYPPARSREKRFEVGFFIRKIVKGWLAYCKKLPAASRVELIKALRAPAPESSEEGSDSGFTGGGLMPLSGHAVPPGDDGPVGETRVEVGAFARVVTESTDDDDS